ncbi:MAG: hypothetical protein ACFE0I_00655 [Elainellaceae cyanobacterium]
MKTSWIMGWLPNESLNESLKRYGATNQLDRAMRCQLSKPARRMAIAQYPRDYQTEFYLT